jgi:hypothetical protein
MEDWSIEKETSTFNVATTLQYSNTPKVIAPSWIAFFLVIDSLYYTFCVLTLH